jgi:miniconductance mechanosensitive channel
LTDFIQQNPEISFVLTVAIALLASPFLQRLIGRAAIRIAIRTETVVDDLIVDALRPYRFVYAIPTALAYFLADWLPPYAYEVRLFSGLISIFLAVETSIKVMNAAAAVIRHKSGAKGVSSTGYIDILKILIVLVGVVAAGTVVVDTDLITLIGGVGAATAVLGLIFKDSLHSIFASIKIASWNLIREGDWLVVPDFGADGTVEHIGLYTSMQDTKARRLYETFSFDVGSVRVCDRALLERLKDIPLISDLVAEKIEALGGSDDPGADPVLAPVITTNFEIFSVYVERYLNTRSDIHQKRHFIMVRTTAPTRHGVPMEIFAFLREVNLVPFSRVQTSIFNHLLAMIGVFDLRLHQSVTEA